MKMRFIAFEISRHEIFFLAAWLRLITRIGSVWIKRKEKNLFIFDCFLVMHVRWMEWAQAMVFYSSARDEQVHKAASSMEFNCFISMILFSELIKQRMRMVCDASSSINERKRISKCVAMDRTWDRYSKECAKRLGSTWKYSLIKKLIILNEELNRSRAASRRKEIKQKKNDVWKWLP